MTRETDETEIRRRLEAIKQAKKRGNDARAQRLAQQLVEDLGLV